MTRPIPNVRARSGSRLAIATTWPLREASIAGTTALRAMSAAPSTPQRNRSLIEPASSDDKYCGQGRDPCGGGDCDRQQERGPDQTDLVQRDEGGGEQHESRGKRGQGGDCQRGAAPDQRAATRCQYGRRQRSEVQHRPGARV